MTQAPNELSGEDLEPARFQQEIVRGCRPVVIRRLVRGWPVVHAAHSPAALKEYLARLDTGGQVDAFFGDPAIGGKYYYNPGLDGFNFERRSLKLLDAVQAIVEAIDRPGAKSVYCGSVPTREYLPGFTAGNPMPLVSPDTSPRIWLGTASNVSSHYDTLDNLACVIAGRRRFTLYAPELLGKLYAGPIDNTMAGQPVSLAAAANEASPGRFPLFEEIRDQALQAELEPGDALYLPKLWWHQVESLAPFNGLINYWWDAFSAGPDAPYTALLLSMITLAERPAAERQAWRAMFDHYVFRTNGHPLAHLPPEQHGLLGPLKPHNYGRIRALVMRLLRGG